jgi:ATP phosphoribosyltransferase
VEKLTIGLAKGRVLKETLPLLLKIGIEITDDIKTTRKLILDTNRPHIKAVILRTTDVPTYVQYGAADVGITGKDSLMEHGGEGLYEPLDLKISTCRLMTAGFPDAPPIIGRPRIATKYVNLAKAFYASKGQQVELIKLYGSMELAPIVGLADGIVDLVDTGNTLKANGLVPLEHISDISSRLVVNKASMKKKNKLIQTFIDELAAIV